MAVFDREILGKLRDAREVRVHAGEQGRKGVVIWVVVSGDEVFLRSVQGPKGAWFKKAVATGKAALEVDGQLVPARAVPVADAAEIDRASKAYLAKYEPSPWAKEMVRPEVLPTTLRLEPLSPG